MCRKFRIVLSARIGSLCFKPAGVHSEAISTSASSIAGR